MSFTWHGETEVRGDCHGVPYPVPGLPQWRVGHVRRVRGSPRPRQPRLLALSVPRAGLGLQLRRVLGHVLLLLRLVPGPGQHGLSQLHIRSVISGSRGQTHEDTEAKSAGKFQFNAIILVTKPFQYLINYLSYQLHKPF